VIPTREDLAREVCERNDLCGHVDGDHICVEPRRHQGEHRFVPVARVIPIN